MDAVHYEAVLPHGFWVKLNVLTSEGNLESLARFEGESTWELSVEDHVTFLRRDGGSPEAIGILPPLDDPDAWLANRDLGRFPGPLSLEIRSPEQADLIEAIPTPVHAYVCDDFRLDGEGLRKIFARQSLALCINVDYGDLPPLGGCAELEFLLVDLSNIPARREEGRVVKEPFELPAMPKLRDLTVRSVAGPPGFTGPLSRSSPNLRFLHHSVGGNLPAAWVDWRGIDAMAGLEAFLVPWGIRVDASELSLLRNLRSLVVGDGALAGSESALADLAPVSGLNHLETGRNAIPPDVWKTLVRSGSLNTLIRLETSTEFDWSTLTALESLRFRLASGGVPGRLDGLATLPNLRSVDLENASQSDLESLGRLPNRTRLEVMRLEKGNYEDVTPLKTLSNLKRLVLMNHSGNLDVVDLAAFTNLSTYLGFLLRNLVLIEGVGDHPTLEVLSARSCGLLAEIGGAGSGSRLKALSVIRCSRLASLDSFGGALSLRQLQLEDSPTLKTPTALTQLPGIDYLHLRNAGEFPNLGRHEP